MLDVIKQIADIRTWGEGGSNSNPQDPTKRTAAKCQGDQVKLRMRTPSGRLPGSVHSRVGF